MRNRVDVRRLLIPAGGALALLCYHLPWGKFSLVFINRSLSGAALGGGYQVVLAAAFLILVAGGILIVLRRENEARLVAVLCALLGLGFMAYKAAVFSRGIRTPLGHIPRPGVSLQAGWIGAFFGFLVALAGAALLRPQRRVRRKGPADTP